MITFIGVGTMGGGMAMNLIKAGYEVRVIASRSRDKLKQFEQAGAKASMNTLDAVDSEYIFMCLPSVESVESVLFGGNGLVKNLTGRHVIIDCSTVGFLYAKDTGEKLEQLGIDYLDAPVSGHKAKADDGTLTIMVGGKKEVFTEILPMFEVMGKNILHMGGYGAGQLTKIINNCALNICTASFCELMPLGVKMGLDPEKIGEVLMTASGSSYASKSLIPEILKGNFEYGFSMERAYKDMLNIFELTGKYAVPLPTLSGTMQTYQLALQNGYGKDYKGAMIKFFEDMLNVKCRGENTDDDA